MLITKSNIKTILYDKKQFNRERRVLTNNAGTTGHLYAKKKKKELKHKPYPFHEN